MVYYSIPTELTAFKSDSLAVVPRWSGVWPLIEHHVSLDRTHVWLAISALR